MIDLFTARTPNGRKVSIMLEELGLPYQVHFIDLSKGEQLTPAFLALNLNNKIPVITDRDNGFTLAESGAILVYLAEKTGRLLAAPGSTERHVQLQWLFFQMASIGPMMGQLFHFKNYQGEPQTYALERFGGEVRRIFRVVEQRLAEAPYLGGEAYSVADIASYPWLKLGGFLELEMADFPALSAWMERLAARSAIARGILVPE